MTGLIAKAALQITSVSVSVCCALVEPYGVRKFPAQVIMQLLCIVTINTFFSLLCVTKEEVTYSRVRGDAGGCGVMRKVAGNQINCFFFLREY